VSRNLKLSIIRSIVKSVFNEEFGESEWWAADFIINKESKWNPYAINSTSGACGLFQFLPCSKVNCRIDDVRCHGTAGAQYIRNRYRTPSSAYSFWLAHSWY